MKTKYVKLLQNTKSFTLCTPVLKIQIQAQCMICRRKPKLLTIFDQIAIDSQASRDMK